MHRKRAFYIGRFQPYHLGHNSIIKRIAKEVDEVVIGIGSAQKSHSTSDPFTAGERVMMIRNALEKENIPNYALPIEDIQQNSLWVSHILSRTPLFDVVYSNNPLVIQLFEEAGIPVKQSPMYQREQYSGTRIRKNMIENKDWRHLVPDDVAEIIDEIDGVTRLKNVSETDIN